jgi:Helix-turn-helix domain
MTHVFEYTVSTCGVSKGAKEELYGTQAKLYVGVQAADVQLLEKGEQNPSQISRDHHVTRSLVYVWWQLYQERGEAAFVSTQAFLASTRSRSTAACARTDCPSGTAVWTTGAGT